MREVKKMKILIGYYTKTGTTAKCADILRAQFHNHEVTVADLAMETVDLCAYEVVLLGASVRMGRSDKRFRTFLRANEATLSEKKTGYFLCAGAPELVEDIMNRDLPPALLAKAAAKSAFGGELNVAAQKNIFGKLIVRAMRSSIKSKELDDDLCYSDEQGFPEILPDSIARFADEIKRI